MMVVAVPTLHKNTAVTKTFSIHFPTNVIEMNAWEEKVDIRRLYDCALCDLFFMLCLHRDRFLFKEININCISDHHLSVFKLDFYFSVSSAGDLKGGCVCMYI